MKHAERAGLRRWTRHEYARLIDHGFLDEDDPIKLLDGWLLVKEPSDHPRRPVRAGAGRLRGAWRTA